MTASCCALGARPLTKKDTDVKFCLTSRRLLANYNYEACQDNHRART